MIYGISLSIQENEITHYCFKKCGKVIFAALEDKTCGPLTFCRQDTCLYERDHSPTVGDVEGEPICLRALMPILEV